LGEIGRRCAPQNENECGCAAQNEVEVEDGRRCAPQNKIENEVEVEDGRRCAPQNKIECGCAAQNEVENGAALCAAERERVRLRRTERG
jgi:hypothetical protein